MLDLLNIWFAHPAVLPTTPPCAEEVDSVALHAAGLDELWADADCTAAAGQAHAPA